MDNILASLEERCSLVAMIAPPSIGLSGGHVSRASDILSAFSDDDVTNTKLELIKTIALVDGITCEEFKSECKQAQKLADQLDALNGFVSSDDSPDCKGVRYGIKRRVLNQRLSEAKRLFGVFKAAPDVLKEKGYNSAVVSAREWLHANNKQWDGASVPSESTRETKAAVAAMKEVASGTPMVAGESIKDYQARIEPLVEAKMAQNKAAQHEENVNKLVKKLAANEDGDVLLTACLRILESQSIADIQAAIEFLSEAKMIAQYEQGTTNE